jgi:hypothetical protein
MIPSKNGVQRGLGHRHTTTAQMSQPQKFLTLSTITTRAAVVFNFLKTPGKSRQSEM